MERTCEKKQKYVFVNYLKAMAAILIINSHYDNIYPVSALATGGAIGNAIFFAVSGFCLYPIQIPFKKWLPKKIIRLYIPTLLMTVIALFTYLKGSCSVDTVFFVFIWPTLFWFVGAIVLFYILFFFLKEIESNRDFAILGLILAILYFIYYIFLLDKNSWVIETKGLDSWEGNFKLIYYFASMMIGKWFRINIHRGYDNKKLYFMGVIISFLSIYGVKYLLNKIPVLMNIQFLNQISVLCFVIFIFMLFISLEESLSLFKNSIVYRVVSGLSNITLDLYLVQFCIIAYASKLIFPVNLVVSTVLIPICAMGLNKISTFIYRSVYDCRGRINLK